MLTAFNKIPGERKVLFFNFKNHDSKCAIHFWGTVWKSAVPVSVFSVTELLGATWSTQGVANHCLRNTAIDKWEKSCSISRHLLRIMPYVLKHKRSSQSNQNIYADNFTMTFNGTQSVWSLPSQRHLYRDIKPLLHKIPLMGGLLDEFPGRLALVTIYKACLQQLLLTLLSWQRAKVKNATLQ